MRRWHRGSGRNQQGGLLSVLPIPTLGCAQSVLFSRAALVNTAKLVSDNGFLNRFLAHQRCGVPVSPGLLSLIAALSPILLLLGCHCFSAVQILALFNCCRSNPLSQPWNEGGGGCSLKEIRPFRYEHSLSFYSDLCPIVAPLDSLSLSVL